MVVFLTTTVLGSPCVINLNQEIFGRNTFEMAVLEQLTPYDVGPLIWSYDERYDHDSFTMNIFTSADVQPNIIPGHTRYNCESLARF